MYAYGRRTVWKLLSIRCICTSHCLIIILSYDGTSVIKSRLECLLDLPWNKSSPENKDLNQVKEVLDKDHYGMDDIKVSKASYHLVLQAHNL